MNEISKSLLKVSCPNCGAQMILKDNYMFKCEYCDTILYVYPKNNVNLIACDIIRSKYSSPRLSQDKLTELNNDMKRDLALRIGEYLLNNNYLYFEDRKDFLTDNDILHCAVKVIRKDEDGHII